MARLVAFTLAGRTQPERKVTNCGVLCFPRPQAGVPQGLGRPGGSPRNQGPWFPASWGPGILGSGAATLGQQSHP